MSTSDLPAEFPHNHISASPTPSQPTSGTYRHADAEPCGSDDGASNGTPAPAPLDATDEAASGIVQTHQLHSMRSLLEAVRDDIFSGKLPVQYAVADKPWGTIALRPGDVIALAAPPGNGKTALVTQLVVDSLRNHPEARCLVVNVEMSAAKLIERQIARLSGVSFTSIANRQVLPTQKNAIDRAIATLAAVGDRLFFMNGPFDIENIALSIQAVEPTVLVLDYVQRIDCGGTLEPRQKLNAVMNEARTIASAGIAVVLISAVGRTTSKRNGGYSSSELGMGSFRESSEVEYGVDDAFVLTDEEDSSKSQDTGPRIMLLRHVKSRNHQRKDLRLEFDGAAQQFRLLSDRTDGDDDHGMGMIGIAPPPSGMPNPTIIPHPLSRGTNPSRFRLPGEEVQ